MLESPTLQAAPTDVKFNFIKTQDFGGKGELHIKGEEVDEVEMPLMHISTYSLAETFDVGRDTGTQISTMYDDPFLYDGALDRVESRVGEGAEVPPRTLGTGVY